MVEAETWYYLDLSAIDAPQVKHPIAVPFNVREPRLLGFGVSDSSMGRLVQDDKPASYRRQYPTVDEHGCLIVLIRTMHWTSVPGMCAVGSCTYDISTFWPWFQVFGGFQGEVEIFVIPIERCVADPSWGTGGKGKKKRESRVKWVNWVYNQFTETGCFTRLRPVEDVLLQWNAELTADPATAHMALDPPPKGTMLGLSP